MTDEYQHILQPYRDQLDDLDDKIVDLLQTREGIIQTVASLKKEQDIPAVLPARVAEVIDRCTARSKKTGSDGTYIHNIYDAIVAQSCALETQIMTTEPDKEQDSKND